MYINNANLPSAHLNKLCMFSMFQVRTPTGTLIDLILHSWGNTMNIDIYMSARDFGHIDGLCGHFDGDGSNDFKKRDGTAVDGHINHTFSESWRFIC